MRINTNVSALQAHFNLGQTSSAAQTTMAKLSSGFRITRAADDAAGLSIANGLRSQVRSLNMASRNIEQANAMLQIAEGAAGSVEKIVERMKELATQAASATNSAQLTTLDDEFQDLKSEIDRIVGATKFQGTALLDGNYSGKTLQIGTSNSSNEQLAIDIDGLNTGSGELAISSALTSTASAQSALDELDDALDVVNGVLAKIGAYQNRLTFAQDNVKTAIVNISATESSIRDADMAAEMSTFSKQQILQQAGTAMLAQANAASQNVLSLLRG